MDDITAVPRPVAAAVTPPRWSPSARELDDAEALLLGAYPGLAGFLGPEDLAAVRAHARLADGTPWPVAVALSVPATVGAATRETGSVVLLDEEGTPVAEVRAERLWDLDGGQVGVAGPLAPLAALERGSHRSLRRPAADATGPGPVLGIALDLPPLAPQLAQWESCARSLGATIRLLPLTGSGRAGALDSPALVRTCLDAATRIGADVIPVAVPHHGDTDRDRLLGALVAGGYGATHVPGPLPPVDAGWSGALPTVVEPGEVVRDLRTDRWEPVPEVPPEFRSPDRAADVCASVQQLVDRGEPVPEWVTGPAVVREYARRSTRTGFTILLTGLSGSGKSTVAKAVHAAVLERTARTVTLLDGDVVRSMLSSELTFSRTHRDLNVRRIGYVAAEVTRHGGIALCAPIAPYAASRDEVRAMISAHGGFLLVHVATPLAVCEARDRKGLYAKARAGLIPEFTGVSDPYEEPTDADLKIDTATVSVSEAVELVLGLAVARGWLESTACVPPQPNRNGVAAEPHR